MILSPSKLFSNIILFLPTACSVYHASSYIPPEWLPDVAQAYPGQPFSFTLQFLLGLVFVPIIIAIVGSCLLISFQISLCCGPCFRRCWLNWCTCLYIKDKDYIQVAFRKRIMYHKWVIVSFIFWLAITLIFTCFIIFPYHHLYDALVMASGSIVIIYNIFTSILSYAQSISNNIGLVDKYALGNPCYLAFQHFNLTGRVVEQSYIIQTAINDTIAQVGNIPLLLTDVNDLINNIIKPTLVPTFWIYFGVVVSLVLAWLSALIFCRSKNFLTFMIILTEIVAFLLVVLYAVELYVVLLNAKFCYPNPTTTVLSSIDSHDNVFETIQFYSTCEGMQRVCVNIWECI